MKFSLRLPSEEWTSVLKGSFIAGAAVSLTYFAQHLSSLNFGDYGPLVVGLLSVLVNILRKASSVGDSDPPMPPPIPPPQQSK